MSVATCSKVCVICNSAIVDLDYSRLYKKGFDKLIFVCNRDDLKNMREELIEKQSSDTVLFVHESCRKTFTFQKESNENSVPTKHFRSSSKFDYKMHCFLCEKKILVRNRQRNKFCFVETLEARDSFKELALHRGDEWGLEVLGKLEACNDLVAEEACYHIDCYNNFRYFNKKSSNPLKRGRPENKYSSNAFDKTCSWLEATCEILTIDEIFQKMCELGGNLHYTKKTLREKLKQRYSDRIYFTGKDGRNSEKVCFKDMSDFIIKN